MNLLEALNEAKINHQWIRPLKWRKNRIALKVIQGAIYMSLVKELHTAIPWIPPEVSILLGEWEVCDPNDVNNGR